MMIFQLMICEYIIFAMIVILYLIQEAHLIFEWKDKTTNIIYNGMPFFENADDWKKNANNVEVIRWICANKNT